MAEDEEITSKFKPTSVSKTIEPIVDLGNLLLEDFEAFESKGSISNEELLTRTRDNTQYLFNQIWALDTKRVEDAICVQLPPGTKRLPREKPLPKPRPLTKWQQYANDKGIKGKTKDKLIWDQQSQSWKPRYGYRRANDDTKDWLIEIPDHADPYKDYFGERLEKKKERVEKNEFQRLRNLSKGRKNQSNSNMTPLGVGLDSDKKSTQELSHQIDRAKTATASIGRFQEKLPNEKPPKNLGKKRQFAPNEQGGKTEKEHQLNILRKLSNRKPRIDAERVFASQQGQQTTSTNEKDDKDKRRVKDRPRLKNDVHRQQHFLKMKKTKTGSQGKERKMTNKKVQKGGGKGKKTTKSAGKQKKTK